MSIRILAASLLLPLVFAQTGVDAGETLRMKFREGERYGYLIKQDMNVTGNVQGKDVSSEMGQALLISTLIKSVEADGSAKAEQTIDRVQMKMVLPPPISQTIEYDTDNKQEPENPIVKQVAANLSKMVGEAISMTISPSGEMSDIMIPEKVRESQQAPGSPVSSGDQLEQMFRQSGLRLPVGEIDKGHKWDQDMDVTLPFGTMAITTTYTYQGQNADGLHKIDATMDIELQPSQNAQVKVTATAKEASGTFLFDNEAGRLTSSQIKQVLDIDIGGIARQSITTLVNMSLTDGAKPQTSRNAK